MTSTITAQIIDLIETYREIAAGVTETYMSAVSNRMNEIMKVLTIISTIFMPLSFIAGVYGMNVRVQEAQWRGMYGVFWVICFSVGGGCCCSGSTAGSGSDGGGVVCGVSGIRLIVVRGHATLTRSLAAIKLV